MYPVALFPKPVFPAPVFPGAGKTSSPGSGSGTGAGVIYPGSLYPFALYPSSLYPGSRAPSGSGSGPGILYPGSTFPSALFPASLFPGSFPGAGSAVGSGILFPGALFPSSIFPSSIFPGSGLSGVVVLPPGVILFEREFLAYLAPAVPGITFWHMTIPQAQALPAAAFQTVDSDQFLKLAGRTGLMWRNVQIIVYGHTFGDCVTWGDAIQKALDGYSGPMGNMTVPSCFLHPDGTSFDPDIDGDDGGTHSFRQEFKIFFYK